MRSTGDNSCTIQRVETLLLAEGVHHLYMSVHVYVYMEMRIAHSCGTVYAGRYSTVPVRKLLIETCILYITVNLCNCNGCSDFEGKKTENNFQRFFISIFRWQFQFHAGMSSGETEKKLKYR